MVGGKCLSLLPVQSVVQKNFIDDEREVAFAAEFIQLPQLFAAHIGPSRIIRVHEQHSACAWRQGPHQRMKINEPAMRVLQGIRNERHILNVSQEIKKRIAWFQHQNFIMRIAQQAEHVGIRFAGARGQQKRIGIDGYAVVLFVVLRHLFACRQ